MIAETAIEWLPVRGSSSAGPAHWRRYLSAVPDWALEDELGRRHERTLELGAIAVRAPSGDRDELVVDPVASLVRWGGVDYLVAGRALEVVYALAVGWLEGRRRMRSLTLARRVWRGVPAHAALVNLHSVVWAIRQRVPGLVAGGRVRWLGYYLALPTDCVGRRLNDRGD